MDDAAAIKGGGNFLAGNAWHIDGKIDNLVMAGVAPVVWELIWPRHPEPMSKQGVMLDPLLHFAATGTKAG